MRSIAIISALLLALIFSSCSLGQIAEHHLRSIEQGQTKEQVIKYVKSGPFRELAVVFTGKDMLDEYVSASKKFKVKFVSTFTENIPDVTDPVKIDILVYNMECGIKRYITTKPVGMMRSPIQSLTDLYSSMIRLNSGAISKIFRSVLAS